MSSCLAAKILMNHLTEISDGAYQVATEIAIEVLLADVAKEYEKLGDGLTFKEYLGLSDKQYEEWVIERKIYGEY